MSGNTQRTKGGHVQCYVLTEGAVFEKFKYDPETSIDHSDDDYQAAAVGDKVLLTGEEFAALRAGGIDLILVDDAPTE